MIRIRCSPSLFGISWVEFVYDSPTLLSSSPTRITFLWQSAGLELIIKAACNKQDLNRTIKRITGRYVITDFDNNEFVIPGAN